MPQRVILFKSPLIVTGDPDVQPFTADVLIDTTAGLISAISSNITVQDETTRIITCHGHILCPGFIDMHAHSDLYLLTHSAHEAKISQGCTTEVVGQDGIAYAPVRTVEQLNAIRSQIAGWNGNPTDDERSADGVYAGKGIFGWNSVGEYLDCLERNGTATNVAMLVPQGNLRLLACGAYDTPATDTYLRDQVNLLRQGLMEGAFGMSSGLTYTPGMYASNSELAVLCTVLADEYSGAYYAPHHRSYGHRAIESYGEMLDLAKDTGCPVHLTHATLNFPTNANRAPELLCMIKKARESGSDITLDTYPYLPGATTLAALLPSWASAGGPAETLERLRDEKLRARMLSDMEKGCDGGHGLPVDWSTLQVGSCTHPRLQSYPTRFISEIAKSTGRLAHEIYFDILTLDQLATSCIMHVGNEENVQAIMRDPQHMSGSDAILCGESTHPRGYGTFPRFLGHYARDLGIEPMVQMIQHLTSRPAKRLGIYPHQGCISVGSAADLVLFDPNEIADLATFEEPKKRCKGIRWVLINGVIGMEEGVLTGKLGGKVLRKDWKNVVT